MKAIVLEEPGHFRMTNMPFPDAPGPAEVKVRVRRIGICGTDMHAFRGRQPFFSYPRILGHELGVTVVETGDGVEHVKPGDDCAVWPYLACGECVTCRANRENCCTTLKVLGVQTDGCMREEVLMPARLLFPSTKLSVEQMALVETLGIGCHAVTRGSVTADDTVLVVGVGPIGMSTIQFAQATGARVLAMDISDHRLGFCRDSLGVSETIDAKTEPIKQLEELTDGGLATCVFDATGHAPSMGACVGYCGAGGRIVFVSLVLDDVAINDPELHRKELTVFASRNSRAEEFAQIVGMIEADKIDTTPWISHRSSFDDMIGQFESWLDPASRVTKTVVSLD